MPRRFPPPRTIEELPARFVVSDGTTNSGEAAHSRDEARRIAASLLKLRNLQAGKARYGGDREKLGCFLPVHY
jgi:hypothetical protein